ncbi:MAG: signal peptidase I [Parvularculales bacterium]
METQPYRRRKSQSGFRSTISTILYAVLVALVVRIFLYQPFNIPSSSMVPNLLVGDYLFVSKFAYGYSRFSFPLSIPFFEGRIFPGELKRGDIVVFRLPSNNRLDYIKRVVGLPGDKIQVMQGVVYIDGGEVLRVPVENYYVRSRDGRSRVFRQYQETLPGDDSGPGEGVSYRVLDITPNGSHDNTDVFTVPDGHFFVMGDNRDNSSDSRVLDHVGYVPYENLVGRASFIFLSHDGTSSWWQFWKWPSAVRWARLFNTIN